MASLAPLAPQILQARVQHARLAPRQNSFAYRLYYLAVDVDALSDPALAGALGMERFGLHSFKRKDHGARDGTDLRAWADDLLKRHGQPSAQRILLVTLPRVLGFVFNPVSFWLCLDDQQRLTTVIAEVNNTFGQTHSYVCPLRERPANQPRAGAQRAGSGGENEQAKTFHVSPFLAPSGSYAFRFSYRANKLAVGIDHRDASGQLLLTTSLAGRLTPLSRPALWRAFFRHPFVTAKVVSLIHWQALRLVAKGQRFLGGPSAWRNVRPSGSKQSGPFGHTTNSKPKGDPSHAGIS